MTNISHWSSKSSRNPIIILMLLPYHGLCHLFLFLFLVMTVLKRMLYRINRPVIAIVVIPHLAQGLSVALRFSFGNRLPRPPTSSSPTSSWVNVLLVRSVWGTRVPSIRSGPCVARPRSIILLVCSPIIGHLIDGCRFWRCSCCAFLGCSCGCSCHLLLPRAWRRMWWLLRHQFWFYDCLWPFGFGGWLTLLGYLPDWKWSS